MGDGLDLLNYIVFCIRVKVYGGSGGTARSEPNNRYIFINLIIVFQCAGNKSFKTMWVY